ncbi:hypothetical protein EVAR_88257_1 [Eumeta japonica]|uniref:Uncharacterized protein n=1 Tax=Eumeta variegata TaxID=151549 RepID=A0A4C1XQ27_EUMVA|nr:hypothetical protein EVAR_88257_1 [Eumeta japonica]
MAKNVLKPTVASQLQRKSGLARPMKYRTLTESGREVAAPLLRIVHCRKITGWKTQRGTPCDRVERRPERHRSKRPDAEDRRRCAVAGLGSNELTGRAHKTTSGERRAALVLRRQPKRSTPVTNKCLSRPPARSSDQGGDRRPIIRTLYVHDRTGAYPAPFHTSELDGKNNVMYILHKQEAHFPFNTCDILGVNCMETKIGRSVGLLPIFAHTLSSKTLGVVKTNTQASLVKGVAVRIRRSVRGAALARAVTRAPGSVSRR